MLRYPSYKLAREDPYTTGLGRRHQKDLEASGRDPDYPARRVKVREEREEEWRVELLEPGADIDGILDRKANLARILERSEVALAAEAALLAKHGPAALAAARERIPEDPYGGHRPVWLLQYGMACLDCDWVVSRYHAYYGSPAAAGREHRSLHLDPPAEGLCEWEPMPSWFYFPYEPGTRRGDGYDWPKPAASIYGTDRAEYQVCTECWAGLRRDGDLYTAPPSAPR